MYKQVASIRAKGGNVGEAVAALKELALLIDKKYKVKTDVYVQQFGPAHMIYTITDFADLAAIQAMLDKWLIDEGIRALVKKADLLIEPPTIMLLQPV
jgi:hypothetical protein